MNASKSKPRISNNSVSLVGEFAVLSHLALWGYDATMTLGRTKNVDILVSDPSSNQLYQLEVKTSLNRRQRPPVSKVHGRFLCDWMMSEKHESISRPALWYCLVLIGLDLKTARYFVVPSDVVAEYVRAEHRLWLDSIPKRKDTPMRMFSDGIYGREIRNFYSDRRTVRRQLGIQKVAVKFLREIDAYGNQNFTRSF